MIINIEADTGITANSINPEVFSMVSSIDSIDRVLILTTVSEDTDQVRRIFDILSACFTSQDGTSRLSLSRSAINEFHIRTAPVINRDNDETGPDNETDNDIFNETGNENEDAPAAEENERDAAPFIINYVTRPLVQTNMCELNDKEVLLAKALQNTLSSNAKNVSDKIKELDNLMSMSIILRNEIALLLQPLKNNSVINDMINKVNDLHNSATHADSQIESAYINTVGNIVIVTKDLCTNVLEDGTVRKIGRMEITLRTSVMLAETLLSRQTGPMIGLRNLSGYVQNAEGSWACGHAKLERLSRPEEYVAVCFGNVDEQIYNAIQSKNIAMAAELVVRFLRNPDINDAWGRNIKSFPIIGGADGQN